MATPPILNHAPNIVPDGKIILMPEHPRFESVMLDVVEPLRNKPHRETLGRHAMHCLPVVVGNQYGFVIRSRLTWSAIWNGGSSPSDTIIKTDFDKSDEHIQTAASHFGSGIITVQNRFSFRTPPGVNLMVLDPPNYFQFNLANLFAVVETDNLRRDFTFNLKIVEPKVRVRVKRGDIICAVIPIPRYFADNFELAVAADHFGPELIAAEQAQTGKMAEMRATVDKDKPHAVGKLYWRGIDADGVAFPDHQKRIRKAGWANEGGG